MTGKKRGVWGEVNGPVCYVVSKLTGLGLERDRQYKVILQDTYFGTVIIERPDSWKYSNDVSEHWDWNLNSSVRTYDATCFFMEDGGNILFEKDKCPSSYFRKAVIKDE